MIKLAVFDFDSTLMDGETIDFLAAERGVEKQVSEITERAMQGEIDFFESLIERVALLKGLEQSKVEAIFSQLPLILGGVELIQHLKQQGSRVVCFSGGFRAATSHASKILGLDADFANELHVQDGCLSGRVGGEMMFSNSKGMMIQRLQKLLSIQPADTMVVGDGANDLSMFAHADMRVAFCARPILQAEATHLVNEKDLRNIIPLL